MLASLRIVPIPITMRHESVNYWVAPSRTELHALDQEITIRHNYLLWHRRAFLPTVSLLVFTTRHLSFVNRTHPHA